MAIPDYLVILNPAAARGGAARVGPVVEHAFRRLGATAEVVHTRAHGHGTELAHEAAEGPRGGGGGGR
jgi:diacylglycerol kinase family enzyme